MRYDQIAEDILFGLAIDDAPGVPVEFQRRESARPIVESRLITRLQSLLRL